MGPASAQEISGLLGDIDDGFAGRILGTGATLDEVAEALGAVEAERQLDEPPHLVSSPRVDAVRAILDELFDEDDDDDDLPPR